MASIAPAGWSDSESEENKENKVPKKRLSLSLKKEEIVYHFKWVEFQR